MFYKRFLNFLVLHYNINQVENDAYYTITIDFLGILRSKEYSEQELFLKYAKKQYKKTNIALLYEIYSTLDK